MIKDLLLFPGRCLYPQINLERTNTEVAVATLAVMAFSAAGSYYAPLTYTFSLFSAFIVYSGEGIAAESHFKEIPENLHQRIWYVALALIVGGKIGQKIREYRFPIQNPAPWYSLSWKTPFHVVNNVSVFVFFIGLVIGRNTLLAAPGNYIFHQVGPNRTQNEAATTIVALMALSAITCYKIPLAYTFSSVFALVIFDGECETVKNTESKIEDIDLLYQRIVGAALSVVFGGAIGRFTAKCLAPNKGLSIGDVINWKIPFRLINLLAIGALFVTPYLRFSLLLDRRPPLPELDYTAKKITKKTNQERKDLINRVKELGEFKIDPKIKSPDDIIASEYILLIDPSWTKEEKKKNYMVFLQLTHTDKNPGIDKTYCEYVSSAAQTLEIN